MRNKTAMLQLLCEDYSLTIPPPSIGRYIQLSELGGHGDNKNAQASKLQQSGFEHRLSRLVVRHFTTELPRSTIPEINLIGKNYADKCFNSFTATVRGTVSTANLPGGFR